MVGDDGKGDTALKNFKTGLYTLFTSTPGGSNYAFFTDIGGRLYDTVAPNGVSLSNGPYAVYSIMTDVDSDTFTENMVYVFLQFSLYSGDVNDSSEIMDMDTHLSTMIKDKVWTVTNETIVYCHRQQGNGPNIIPANTEAGTGEYWQTTVDYEVLINRA